MYNETVVEKKYNPVEYEGYNKDSLLNYCINKYAIESFGTFNSFVYYDIDKFLKSNECSVAVDAALKWAKSRGYKPVSKYQLFMNSTLSDRYKRLGYEALFNKTALACRQEGAKTRIDILFKAKDNPDGSILCRGKHFATIKLVKDDVTAITKSQESLVSALNVRGSLAFDNYCDYMNTLQDEWKELSVESLIFLDEHYEKSFEGFIDKAKIVGKKILDGIIFIIKTIASWIMKFITFVAGFIKNNVIAKLFPKKDPKEISQFYAAYGRLPLTLEDNLNSEGNPILSEKVWNELLYMKFDTKSFSILERVTAQTKVAVDTIHQIMTRSYSNNMFIRVYNARYGNQKEEAVAKTNNEPLEFYHERNFMSFLVFIDQLTNGNIKDLIIEDPDDKDRLERTIHLESDLKYQGSTVAKAIICQKTLEKMAEDITNSKNRNDSGKIPIKDFLSEDLLKKLYSQDQSYFKQIDKEAQNTLNICSKLQSAAKKFYGDLENLENNLHVSTMEPNYYNIRKYQGWITFLVEFSKTFFEYRMNMIKIIKLIMKKFEDKNIENNSIQPGTYNSRIGKVRIYSKEEFDKLSKNEIQIITKDIVNKTLNSYLGINRLPVYVFAFKKADSSIPGIGKINQMGSAYPLIVGPGIDLKNVNEIIKLSNSGNMDGDENSIKSELIKYLGSDIGNPKNVKTVGSLILLDANIYKYEKLYPAYIKLHKILSPSLLYFSYVVHETVHTLQLNDVKNNFIEREKLTKGYYGKSDSEKFITEDRKKYEEQETANKYNSGYFMQSYLLNNQEAESITEQRNFIFSIKRNPLIEFYVKRQLSLVGFIHRV
jgi:hypothetical protein